MSSDQKYMSIRRVAESGYATEYHMRLMHKQGRLPGIYSGRTFKVNVPMLVELLDRESLAQVSGQAAREARGE